MANGKKGDHPATDIVDWGLEVYGEPIDSLIRQLYEQGRIVDMNAEVQFWSDISPVEIEEQLRGILIRAPSVQVDIQFEHKVAERFGVPGPGWIFRGAVQSTDPHDVLEETWSVDFFSVPIRLEAGQFWATARPVSASAPSSLLAPGAIFWIRAARSRLGRGRVLLPEEQLHSDMPREWANDL
jgi:hypothetical protein